jgi:hypothetical protein
MKSFSILLLLFAIGFPISSCHRNRLKVNEKELAKELILQEKERSEADHNAREKELADTLNRSTKGPLYKEDRSVDRANPPVIIDLAGSLNNVKEVKLSDVASEVRYIRMQTVPDSTILTDIKFKYYLMDNYIVALNFYGTHLYAKDGRYIRQVVRNELTGMTVAPERILLRSDYTLKGGGFSVLGVGNTLFYNYSNNITGENYIMEYDCSSTEISTNYKFDPENQDKISGLGKVLVDLNHGKTKAPEPRNPQGMIGASLDYFYKGMGPFMLDPNSYATPSGGENMMTILNNNGDTLSNFTLLETLTNYIKSVGRGTDSGTKYEIKGKLYFRPPFNDTVFNVLPPNRLLPVYVLNLGNYKITKQQGLDPDFDLTGRIIPEEWAETNKFIFLSFTKDNYDSPANRLNKKVKFYYALFSKLNHQLNIIKGNPFDYSSEILENDLDGGIPVWPLSYMIGSNSEIFISLKGKELKDRVKSQQFKLSTAPASKKKELEKMAGSVSDNEDILMIIK